MANDANSVDGNEKKRRRSRQDDDYDDDAMDDGYDEPRAPRRPLMKTRLPLILLLLVACLASAAAGAVVMRHRYHQGDVVAAVNGEVIDKASFYHRLEQADGANVLRKMALEDLQLQYAKKVGMAPTDAAVDKRYNQLLKNPQFAQQMAASGQWPDDVKRAIRLSLAEAATLSRGVTVTDADIQKFYQMNIDKRNLQARYYRPAEAQVAVIVTPKEDQAYAAYSDLNNGASFGLAAKTHSVDKSKEVGGLMPPIAKGRNGLGKYPGLEDAVFALKKGDQIGPKKFGNLWWIIRCMAAQPEAIVPFDKVKDECRRGALLVKGLPANGQKVNDGFRKFVDSAQIQPFWGQYASALKLSNPTN